MEKAGLQEDFLWGGAVAAHQLFASSTLFYFYNL